MMNKLTRTLLPAILVFTGATVARADSVFSLYFDTPDGPSHVGDSWGVDANSNAIPNFMINSWAVSPGHDTVSVNVYLQETVLSNSSVLDTYGLFTGGFSIQRGQSVVANYSPTNPGPNSTTPITFDGSNPTANPNAVKMLSVAANNIAGLTNFGADNDNTVNLFVDDPNHDNAPLTINPGETVQVSGYPASPNPNTLDFENALSSDKAFGGEGAHGTQVGTSNQWRVQLGTVTFLAGQQNLYTLYSILPTDISYIDGDSNVNSIGLSPSAGNTLTIAVVPLPSAAAMGGVGSILVLGASLLRKRRIGA